MEFYKRAFGARELARNAAPDGKLIHGSLQIGTTAVMLSDLFPGADTASPRSLGTSTVTMHINSTDVDRLWARALTAGAKVSMPLENQFWGARYGKLVDPFGHHWSVSQPVKMTAADKKAKRAEAAAMFASGEHPG